MKGYWAESINLCDTAGANYDVKGLRISDDFISIDTSELPHGKYFLTFTKGAEVLRTEFVKE